MKVLRIISAAHGIPSPVDGGYVVRCDVDARGGRGEVEATTDPRRALHFPDTEWALRYWRRQSRIQPLRPDGLPNRPLTAYTVEVEEAPAPRYDA